MGISSWSHRYYPAGFAVGCLTISHSLSCDKSGGDEIVDEGGDDDCDEGGDEDDNNSDLFVFLLSPLTSL